MVRELKPWRFDPSIGEWKEITPSGASVDADSLTLVTFNLWFGDFFLYERLDALLEIVRAHDPDVIAFQEVESGPLEGLLATEWIRDSYQISDATGRTLPGYGVVMLSRLPLEGLGLRPLPSGMGRKLLVGDFRLNERLVKIATVHLESMRGSAAARAEQLGIIQPLLREADQAVLMGDLNHCSSWPEETDSIDADFHDLWSLLRPDEQGFTIDTDINTMRRNTARRTKKARLDRVLLHSRESVWKPCSIERLGMEPISPKTPDVFPSDHFGLVVRLVRETGEGE